MRSPLAAGAVASTVALLVAGCGSGSSTNTTSGANNSPYSGTRSNSAAANTTSTTSTASTSASAGMVIVSKHGHDGTILAAGPKRLTVYLFEGDHGSTSACSGACAQVWPPVTTTSAATVRGAALAADLGTIKRSDGTTQITYKGHPLYFYAKDKDGEDAYGQDIKSFGASWYVLKPSGEKLENS